ncbi:hypothetical protein HWV62_15004 [Athelia sp. TMB]|nr:hypothetical protein HWV62_15004 [Athelia sp. TMB]
MGSAYDALRVYKHGYSVFFALYCIVNFFSNFGPNTTTFIVPGEAYPTHCRSTAHGISAASGKLGAVIAQVAFAWIVENTAEGNGMRNLSTEPDVQDNKVQAEQRKKWSNLAAVDNDWIHAESRKNYPPSKITQGRLISVKETSPLSLSSAPALLVTETQQHTRRSRPPVSAASPGAALALSVCAGIPVVSVHLSEEVGGRAHRSRHRRGKRPSKDVTQPTFWKPDPTLKGKSSGYALGYPGNWLALAARSKRYERDTMKKGIFTSEPSVMTSL